MINPAMPDSDHAIANEGSIVTPGMTYIHIPRLFDALSETTTPDVMTAFCEKKFGYIASSTLGLSVSVICRRTEALAADAQTFVLAAWMPQMMTSKAFIGRPGGSLGEL